MKFEEIKNLDKKEIQEILNEYFLEYETLKNENIKLDMSRGKPCSEQLDLSSKMMDVLSSSSILTADDGTDCRNYGVLSGIPECKKMMADLNQVEPSNIMVFGNSSLKIMYDLIANAFLYGICGSTPWSKLEKIKWLCPVPGYDRHFGICESLGIEMINIPMTDNGPDMDIIEKIIGSDDSVKGIWCVPHYSNPDGITYSDDTVRRFANLKPKAKDFRIFWDDAYSVHHLYKDDNENLLEILSECTKAGNEDLVYKFSSTSKISFPGSGVAALATSDNNIQDITKSLKFQTIGYDKINQLRHVRFFKNLDGIKEQMFKHAEILRPKFEIVENALTDCKNDEFCSFKNPKGGYFISLYTVPHCATRVYELCKECGLKLTPVGCAYPYHIDPSDSHLRIAPSFPSCEELKKASQILAIALKIASLETIL